LFCFVCLFACLFVCLFAFSQVFMSYYDILARFPSVVRTLPYSLRMMHIRVALWRNYPFFCTRVSAQLLTTI
jgi:hypothetical protein